MKTAIQMGTPMNHSTTDHQNSIVISESNSLAGRRSLYRIHDKDSAKGCHPLQDIADATYWNKQGWGIFWTVNRFNGPRRKENCTEVISWAADLDEGSKVEQLERIRALPLSPSGIVETARGYHVYFDAKPGANPENYRDIAERVVKALKADTNAKDVCRILRVPGFNHCKSDNPFQVRCIESNAVSYSEDDMRAAFPTEVEQKAELRQSMKTVGADDLWEKVYALDCEQALMRLSGTLAVNHEQYSFQPTSNGGKNILVNGKGTSCWIDSNGRIGSCDKGGPTIWQWLYWFHKDHKRVHSFVRDYFPELFDDIRFSKKKSTETESQSEEWLAPVPFDNYELPDFPVEAFPQWVGNMVNEVARFTETPVEMPGLMALGMLSAAVGGKYSVEVKPGYCEPITVYAAASLPSGNRKTAVQNALSTPIQEWQASKQTEMRDKILEAKSKRQSEEALIASMRRKLSPDNQSNDALIEEISKREAKLTEVPKAPVMIAMDVTPEKLAVMLAENDERLAIISDEAGIFEILDGRYSEKLNLDLWLKAHAGSPHVEHRMSREPVVLNRPALTIAVSPQPDVIRGLAENKAFRGRGLLGRFLYVMPRSKLGHRQLNPNPLSYEIREKYHRGIKTLLNRKGCTEPLKFPVKGFEYWLEFSQKLEPRFREGGDLEFLRDWGGKLPGAAARIAALFHLAATIDEHQVPLTIDEGTVLDALQIAKALIPHAQVAFSMMSVDSTLDNAQIILQWIKRIKMASFSRRDCQVALRSRFPRVEGLKSALNILVERHHIRPVSSESAGPGRPSTQFEVNPEVLKEVGP